MLFGMVLVFTVMLIRRLRITKRARYDYTSYKPKPDHPDWVRHKETDLSWAEWHKDRKQCKVEIS